MPNFFDPFASTPEQAEETYQAALVRSEINSPYSATFGNAQFDSGLKHEFSSPIVHNLKPLLDAFQKSVSD
jgi:hypothetical protein